MAKIDELKFDDKNFNKHTQQGLAMLEKSLRQNGAGRSILIDKNNRIIAGNGVVETAAQIGLDDVQIVESDGTKIIAVKRTDIDLDTKQGREMALADNATASADLAWDTEALADVAQAFDINVGDWGVELITPDEFDDNFSLPEGEKSDMGVMTFIVTDSQRDLINYCLEIANLCEGAEDEDNKNANGAGLAYIVSEWLKSQNVNNNKSVQELEEEYKGLRIYLRDALKISGKKASEIDELLGTVGMSGHYFGASLWMFPTKEAYEKMATIMPLNRDWKECRQVVRDYHKVKALQKYKI